MCSRTKGRSSYYLRRKDKSMAAPRSISTHVPKVLILGCCIVVLLTAAASACTSFVMAEDGHFVFGKNYDWFMDHGLIVVNKRGVPKNALMLDPTDRPAQWVSKYGSVTFNQYGREIPNGGINEAGLVLEVMMLPGTKYPRRDVRPALMAWVQYQLDNSATILDVIASDEAIRVSGLSPMPLHFLGCDRQGNVATFEWLDGKFVVHRGQRLPVTVLTNDTYAESLDYLKQHVGHGGSRSLPHGSWGSLDRFVCATDRVVNYTPTAGRNMVQYAFETLASVRQGDSTKWMIVYDLETMEIHYKTVTCNEARTIRVNDCDFDPHTPVKIVSINTPHTGLLNPHFFDYDTDLNRWMIHYAVAKTPEMAILPAAMVEMLASYPEAPAVTYVLNWEAAGPYMQDGASYQDLYDIPLGPERPGAEVGWKPVVVQMYNLHSGHVDLLNALGEGTHRVAYLRSRIESKEAKPVHLDIYTDDGVKVWLNGQVVHGANVGRGMPVAPDKVTVALKQGTNELMLKVTQGIGPWGAIVRMRPVIE